MKIELVKALKIDMDFLFQLRKSTMVPHLEKAGLFLSDEEQLSRVLFHLDNAFIVMFSGKKVGLLKYIVLEKTIEILQIQILPVYQGKGIASFLIEDLKSKSKMLEKELFLKVLKENPARFLYKRVGFQVIDEDPYEFHMKFI